MEPKYKNSASRIKPITLKPLAIVISASFVATSAMAGNSWLSKSVVINPNEAPVSYYSTNKRTPKALTDSSQTLFDITISLYNAPAGDDDPSTDNGDAQEVHEEIIEYFADAVCEQTNGAHKLRKVSIFKNRKHQAKADIIWNEKEWPRANLAGFGANGAHIYFGDIFPGTYGDKDMLADTKGSGYTLGHEWGHYTYGLLDEYKGKADSTASARKPQKTDLPPSPSIMSNQWRARSEGAQWLNHSTSNNIGDTARTAQGRVYGKSGWEILVQDPKDDPKSGQKTAQPQRTRYLALDAVKPGTADNWVKEELPNAQSDCRSELDIVWVDGDIDMQIVIDRSGSMGGTPIANARQAAKLLVDATAEGTTSLGVVSFSGSARQDSAVQPIPSPGATVKTSIKQTIDAINSGGSTALFDGAQLALSNLVSYQTANSTGAPGVVFVLADGDDNSSFYRQSDVIANYQNANIPIFSFGYGTASPTGPLLSLANGTGGKYFASPTTLAEITDAFLQANALATDSQNLADASSDIPSASDVDFDLQVDSGIANISLFFSHTGNTDDVSYQVTDANGDPVSAVFDCLSLASAVSCSANIDEVAIGNAAIGQWKVTASNLAGFELPVSFNASAEPSDTGTFNVTVDGANGNSVEYPEPMILTTAIKRDRAITGVNVSATIVDPSLVESQIQMVDDGTNGDGTANDGIYSAIVPYQSNGIYQVTVLVDNNDSNASFTSVGLLTPNEDGTQPEAPPLPAIQENFFRVSKTSLVVSDVPFSDGDDTVGGSNLLTPDNTGFDSQINDAADVDFYRADSIDTGTPLFVRITDMSLGMQPKISVLSDDGVTAVVTGATLSNAVSATGYLYTEIAPANLTSTMYVKVEHEDSTASLGGYQISLGPQLNTDVPPNAAPVAADDNATLFVGQNVTIMLLDNDSDDDGDTLSVDSVEENGALGTVTQNVDGSITFDAGTGYDQLNPGQTQVEQMTYIVSDGNGGFTQGNISVTVKANSLPTVVDDAVAVDEVGTVTITPLANDSDDDGHTLSILSVDSTQLVGTLTDNNDGTFTYDPAGNFNLLAAGQSDTETISYMVADELNGESSGSIVITINGINQQPNAQADTASVSESATVDIDVLANDSDADMDSLTVVEVNTDSTMGTATINGNGGVTYSPNGAYNGLNSGQTNTDTFTYTVSDGTETVSATVTVTISGVSEPQPESEKSGGGLFWLLPLCLVLLGRKKRNS